MKRVLNLAWVLPAPAALAVAAVFWAGGHDLLSRDVITAAMLLVMMVAAALGARIGEELSLDALNERRERDERIAIRAASNARIETLTRQDAWRPRLLASQNAMQDARDVIARAAMAADKGSPEQARLGAIAARLQGEAIQIKELRL
jgi:hypothetical protein